VVDQIQQGNLKDIFIIGGCDGTETNRNYYSDLAKATPDTSLILTLGCGKFRVHGNSVGDIGGIPRVLDIGQCNDAYSAVVVATALSKALNCSIHDLPLHFAISWFEQKAVCILLALLHLNIKNIKLGPNLPGFITPNVLDFLVKT